MTSFSIIIPCYNVAPVIEASIQSVLQQDYDNYQLVLIDDGSTDDTWKKLKTYLLHPRVRILQNESNSGVSFTRNRGLSESTGDFVLFLDGDDQFSPGLLKALDTFISKHPQVSMVSFGYEIRKASKTQVLSAPKYDQKILDNKDFLKLYFSRSIRQHLCSMAVSREIIKERNLQFDEHTHAGEDQEFQIKAQLYSQTVGFLAPSFFRYFIREDSVMHAPFHQKRISVMDAVERLDDLLGRDAELYPHFINYASMEYFSLLKHAVQSGKKDLLKQVERADWILKRKGTVFVNKQAMMVFTLKQLKNFHPGLFKIFLSGL